MQFQLYHSMYPTKSLITQISEKLQNQGEIEVIILSNASEAIVNSIVVLVPGNKNITTKLGISKNMYIYKEQR